MEENHKLIPECTAYKPNVCTLEHKRFDSTVSLRPCCVGSACAEINMAASDTLELLNVLLPL